MLTYHNECHQGAQHAVAPAASDSVEGSGANSKWRHALFGMREDVAGWGVGVHGGVDIIMDDIPSLNYT